MANEGPVSQTIVVVGGDIFGITEAVEAAEFGCDAALVERIPVDGGQVARILRHFPKLCRPTCGLEINFQRVKWNPRIRFSTKASVTGVSGCKREYGFVVPSIGDEDAMFSAGVAGGPLDVAQSVQSATAATLRAAQPHRRRGRVQRARPQD